MAHNIDTVLADCRTLAQEMATAHPLATMTMRGLRDAVTERFTWLRYGNDIQLVMGMLAAILEEHGWHILFDEHERIHH